MTDTKEAPVFSDEMQELSFKTLEGLIKERNSLVGTINAANGDRLDLVEQLTEESTDPDIVAAREARDEAINALNDLVRPKVEEIIADAGASVEEATEKVKELDGKLKPGISYYKKMYGDEAAEFFTPTVRSRSMRIGSSGTGGRRVRGFNLTVTADGVVEEFENFATASKYLGVETPVLQEAFFKAAGDPKQVKDAPDQVQFNVTFTATDEDENEVEVNASILAYRPDADDAE